MNTQKNKGSTSDVKSNPIVTIRLSSAWNEPTCNFSGDQLVTKRRRMIDMAE